MNAPTVVDVHKKDGVRPHYTMYAGRHVQYTEFTEDSKWCNPFSLEEWGPAALAMYDEYITILLIGSPGYIVMDLFTTSPAQQAAIDAACRRAFKRWGAHAWDIDELTDQICGCWCVTTAAFDYPKCHVQILMRKWKEKHHDTH